MYPDLLLSRYGAVLRAPALPLYQRRCKGSLQYPASPSRHAYDFAILFPVILTDRGGEYRDPDSLETSPDGIKRTSIYYCDPMRSCQKAGIENVHSMLRMILLKGIVFTNLTQWDVRKCVDHINNTPRRALNGSTPYLEASRCFEPEVIKALKLRYVAPDDVMLSPKLLSH